jgi:hypothetical protein
MDTSETGLEKIIVDWLVGQNGIEYCILTEMGTELYKAINTQETAGSTQEMLSKRANKFGKGLG